MTKNNSMVKYLHKSSKGQKYKYNGKENNMMHFSNVLQQKIRSKSIVIKDKYDMNILL